ncbi:hypothetical protein [Streptomyces beihaiensis]|uniref:Uncharacterized protein n=1 Tax=Streptomyces beihaiensis TaxID=2984495 RepID=A0ABT3U491_9ACTN|nr:hypothetical protein [Streptomyces beihaiensis]MCX3064149.1 hypothetical protein [Streptomyces beihaiensis]
MTHPFLGLPPVSAEHFACVEDRVARLLGVSDSSQDVLITQARRCCRWWRVRGPWRRR